ncbi:MAG TPA: UDP-N-acetylmuramoyl-tripeptide--D-alanyl-D-alanine ligase [Streptosporangiaceae bacterium]|nr:UDP-N-acetylmuramoyl-tripeptide--D-alanyl-D-alanine ligase [Streptosporangiaceae bacterium]
MIPLTLGEIAAITGGTLHGVPDASAQVAGPATCDSRQVTPGGLFAALPGTRADGHDFAAAALAAGAACVLASRPVGGPAAVVLDVTAALGALARHVLSRAVNATLIALTGSAGKTTTKDMLRHVLAQHGRVIAPPGSFNNEIGLPLTVLQADDTTRYLVLEMGTRHIGDIRYLTTLTPPQIGIVLNIGSAHIGEFGSRDAIAQAKAELVEALPDAVLGGIAILNADDPIVSAMAARTTAKAVSYGTRQADIRATGIRLSNSRASFTLHTPAGSAPVNLRLLGAHQVHNALAVAAAAHSIGMGTAQIAAALSTAEPSPGRLQILDLPGNITVINDAFNANPESMTAGLRSFAGYSGNRRMVAVLGEMRELGPSAQAAHEAIGQLVGGLGIHLLITVGRGHADDLARAAQSSATPPLTQTAETPEALHAMLPALLKPDDVVFVKASRSVGLENFAAILASS